MFTFPWMEVKRNGYITKWYLTLFNQTFLSDGEITRRGQGTGMFDHLAVWTVFLISVVLMVSKSVMIIKRFCLCLAPLWSQAGFVWCSLWHSLYLAEHHGLAVKSQASSADSHQGVFLSFFIPTFGIGWTSQPARQECTISKSSSLPWFCLSGGCLGKIIYKWTCVSSSYSFC